LGEVPPQRHCLLSKLGGEVLTFHSASSASAFGYQHPFQTFGLSLASLLALRPWQPENTQRKQGA